MTKEGLESFSDNKNVSLIFYLTLVMLPAKQDNIFQKDNYKQNSVWPYGTSNGKIIFALSEDIITFHVSLILVNIWESGLQ